MKKTVFLDLQNTILPNVCLLKPKQKEMLKKIAEKYNLIISSSVFPSDLDYFNELNGLNLNYLANSGAYAKINGHILEVDFSVDLANLTEYEKDIYFLFYEKKGIFSIFNYKDTLRSLYPIKPKETIFIKTFKNFTLDTYPEIICCMEKGSSIFANFYNKDNINRKIIGEDRTKILFRILRKNVNKGYLIPKILKLLNADFNNTLAIGDSREDLALFENVKRKIAVANAEDDLINKCEEIVPSYLEDGALNYLVNNA